MRTNSDDFHLALPIGTRLNEFRIERVLGSGGFGITYAAYDTDLRRTVAIKEFFPNMLATRLSSYAVAVANQNPEDEREFARQLKRFLNEATILAQLDHPNLVRVARYMRANGTGYFVMEYLEGKSLEQHFCSSDYLPTEEEVTNVLHQILNGLECLHSRKMLHRDLKPDNVLIAGNRAVIIDLGLAKTAVPYSVTGEAFCTPGFTPFEQYQTHGDMGPWTDIYALGATMHKILTAQAPPEALKRLDRDPYVPLTTRLAGHYSPRLLGAIDRALAVNVAARPASVVQFRKLLGGATRPRTALSFDPKSVWPFRGWTLPKLQMIAKMPQLPSLPHRDQLPFDPRFMIAAVVLLLIALFLCYLTLT